MATAGYQTKAASTKSQERAAPAHMSLIVILGDDEIRRELELTASRDLKWDYEYLFPAPARKKRKLFQMPSPSPGPDDRPNVGTDVLSFLKSRPQIGSLQKSRQDGVPSVKDTSGTTPGRTQSDLVENTHFEGHRSAWQHSETIDAFLRRLPVDNPYTPTEDGWLWVGSRMISRSCAERPPGNIATLQERGNDLLDAFNRERAQIESRSADKASRIADQQVQACREQLESSLLTLAKQTNVTHGKWMLFPSRKDLKEYWRLVATATSEGKLGSTSKSAVFDPSESDTVICIYTEDFSDGGEVRRVLEELVELGIINVSKKPIYYKCDAYTHLGLTSKNEQGLKMSLYNSKEVLQKKAMSLADGPIARMKRQDTKTRDFHQMFEGDDIH